MGRRNLKILMPYIHEQLDKGRNKQDIYKELELTRSAQMNIEQYLRREKMENEDYVEEYLIVPEKLKEHRKIFYDGKWYTDVTEDLIDCGG